MSIDLHHHLIDKFQVQVLVYYKKQGLKSCRHQLAETLNISATANTTYRGDIEGPDGVFCKILHLFQRDLNVPVCSRAIRGPVLVALDLQREREREKTHCVFLSSKWKNQYLVLLLEVGHHDDGGCVQLPYHAPEVWESGGNWTLGGYVPVGTLEGLEVADKK